MKIETAKSAAVTALALLITGIFSLTLAACGDATSTLPPQTTAATVQTTTAANPTTASATSPNAAGNNGTPAAAPGNPNPPFTGTITSFDTTAKSLIVAGADGATQTFNVLPSSRINKPVKIDLTELGTLANGTNNIMVMGQKAADGSYSASALTIIDQASMLAAFGPSSPLGNNGNGANGNGNGRGAAPNAGSPAAANGNPGGGAGRGPAPNGTIQVLRGTLSGTKLTGTDISGAPITVNLTDSTALVKLIAGSQDDLKAGTKVSVIYRPGTNNGPATAAVINLVQA